MFVYSVTNVTVFLGKLGLSDIKSTSNEFGVLLVLLLQ